MTKDNRPANDQNGINTAYQLAPFTLEVKKGNITHTPDVTTYNIPIIINVDNGGTIPGTNENGLHLESCDLTTNNGHANIDGNLTVTGTLEVENPATFGAGVKFKGAPVIKGSLQIDGRLTADGPVEFTNPIIKLLNLPNKDPNEKGQVWNDNGTLKISS